MHKKSPSTSPVALIVGKILHSGLYGLELHNLLACIFFNLFHILRRISYSLTTDPNMCMVDVPGKKGECKIFM